MCMWKRVNHQVLLCMNYLNNVCISRLTLRHEYREHWERERECEPKSLVVPKWLCFRPLSLIQPFICCLCFSLCFSTLCCDAFAHFIHEILKCLRSIEISSFSEITIHLSFFRHTWRWRRQQRPMSSRRSLTANKWIDSSMRATRIAFRCIIIQIHKTHQIKNDINELMNRMLDWFLYCVYCLHLADACVDSNRETSVNHWFCVMSVKMPLILPFFYSPRPRDIFEYSIKLTKIKQYHFHNSYSEFREWNEMCTRMCNLQNLLAKFNKLAIEYYTFASGDIFLSFDFRCLQEPLHNSVHRG